jgi:nicotinamidase-related amidase
MSITNRGLLNLQLRQMTLKKKIAWDPKKTAAIICDMWDEHWCKGASSRVAEMAPRMNEVIRALRNQGVLIIHAPSGTMDFYKDHPCREWMRIVSPIETDVPLLPWVHFDPKREGAFPIDYSDGGCDCEPQCQSCQVWSRQIELIELMDGDAITDNADAYYLMKTRQIENVIIMGVHTNICVLGRPFGIRQLVTQEMNVLLMRDMTDTMYNPRMRPYVDHFTGNGLVFQHIEKYWCPTMTSNQIIGGQPFRFQSDTRTYG